MANPVNELRTFLPTNRRPGMEEATFYAKHIQFENSLDYALQVTFQAAESGHVGEDDLNLAVTEAKRFNEIMSSFNKLNFQHFPAYRGYYIGHEDYVGPSGYFSARVLAMDLALSGFDILDERHQDAVNQNRDCFPVLEHGLISKGVHIANTNRSLRELAAAEGDESIVNLHQALSEQMDNFRQRHAGVARALIPELETGDHGTADRADVLSTRQELHKKTSGCPVRGILRALTRKPVHEEPSGFDKEGLRQKMVADFLDNRGFEIPLTMPVPLPLLVPVAR